MRPAYLLAETAAQFQSEIELVKDDIRVDGKSVLGILTLGATQGTKVLVEAAGDDAKILKLPATSTRAKYFCSLLGKTDLRSDFEAKFV